MSGRKAFVGSIVLAMALGLFAAACSSARTTASAPNATSLGKGAAGAPAAPRSAPNQQRSEAFAGTVDVPVLQPKVVKNADLSLRVKAGTFADVFQQATLVAGRHGGYVASSQTNGSRLHSGSVVIRVPAEQFDAALADLRGLGRVESEHVSGDDVTAQFVDLQARLKNWQAQEGGASQAHGPVHVDLGQRPGRTTAPGRPAEHRGDHRAAPRTGRPGRLLHDHGRHGRGPPPSPPSRRSSPGSPGHGGRPPTRSSQP